MPRQLLVRELADGREELDAVAVADTTSTAQVEDEFGAYAPELGTVDLLRLAHALESAGYRLRGLELRTSRFERLDSPDEEEIEAHIVKALRADGPAAALQELDRQLRSLLVVGVELKLPQGSVVTLKRTGALLAQEQQDLSRFLDALRTSWRKVRER